MTSPTYSGGKFALPSANASGRDPGYLNATKPSRRRRVANAALSLQLAGTVAPGPTFDPDPAKGNPADTTCTICPYMVVPGYASPVPVLMLQSRGRFDSGITRSTGKYHARLRQRFLGDREACDRKSRPALGTAAPDWQQAGKLFNDMWSPASDSSVDPRGDRKTTCR